MTSDDKVSKYFIVSFQLFVIKMISNVTFVDFIGPSGRPKFLREGDNKLLELELCETNSALYERC